MSKDITSKHLEEQQKQVEDLTRAVFVDTDLDTHLVIPVSSHFTVLTLKREICVEHFKFFPEYEMITVKSVLVKFHNNYYHLPNNMLLKTVFHDVGETWFVFADVSSPAVPHHPFAMDQVEQSHEFKCIEPSTQPNNESQQVHTMGDHQNKPNEDHRHSSFVHSSQELLEDGQNAIKILEEGGNNTNVDKSRNKECDIDNIKLPISSKVTRKRKKGDTDDPLNTEKDIKEGSGFIELIKSTKKRKTNENKRETLKNEEVVVPSPLSLQNKQLNSHDKEKKIGEDVVPLKSRETAKKRKNKKDKNFGTTNLDLSSEGKNDDKSVEPKDIIGPGEGGETTSGVLNETQNGVLVPGKDPLVSIVKEQLDEANRGMGPPLTVNLQSEKHKKGKKNKSVSLVDDSCSPLNSKLGETTKETNTLEKVEQVECKTNYDSSNVIEGVKEDAPSKSEETTKKTKNSKGKSSSSYTQDLSNKIKNDDQNGSDATKSLRELPKSNSGKSKKSRPKKDIPKSHVEMQPSNEVREMTAPIGVIQSNEPTIKSPKKKPYLSEDISSLPENQHKLDETMLEMDTPQIVVEQADCKSNYDSVNIVERVKELKDDVSSKSENTNKKNKNKKGKRSVESAIPSNSQKLDETMLEMNTSKMVVAQIEENLTNCDTIDSPLKSENIVKKRKTNESELERKTEEVPMQNPNNVPNLLSQHESSNLVENKKKFQEDLTLKSENAIKIRKNTETKSSVIENNLNEGYINRPEESVETTSRKSKKSSKSKN